MTVTADLTREQAREQVARAIHTIQCGNRCEWTGAVDPWEPDRLRLAAAALSVLWPEVERLTRERDEWRKECASAVRIMERLAAEACGCVSAPDFTPSRAPQSTRRLPGPAGSSTVASRERDDEVERLRTELAHAHAVIARHVEPRRGPDCTPGAPSADETCPPRVPGQDGDERA